MKSEAVTVIKTIAIVFVAVLFANAVERKFLSSKVNAPMVAPTQE